MAYFVLHNYDFKESEFRILLTRSKAYLDELHSLPPIRLDGEVSYAGQVGTRSSLYGIGDLAVGSTYRIAITGLQVDADLFVFSDPHYREEMTRSSERYNEDDFVTVSKSADVLIRRVGALNLGGSVEPLANAVGGVGAAVEKGATTVLIPCTRAGSYSTSPMTWPRASTSNSTPTRLTHC